MAIAGTKNETAQAVIPTGETAIGIAPNPYTIRLENRILQVFSNGSALDTRKLPGDTKKQVRSNISQEIIQSCADMFGGNGELSEERRGEWRNIEEIAPAIVSILTARDNYILKIDPANISELVRFCISVARNPDIWEQTTISTGFGGSADDTTSARLPAYAISPLLIVRGLRDFYSQREGQALQRTRGMNREDISIIRARFGIPSKLPTVQLFFADHTAMAINHQQMLPHEIDERTTVNKRALEAFVAKNFRDVADVVEYRRDKPVDETELEYWEREYCRQLLESSEDERIQQVLASLQKTGFGAGGDHGRHNAALYAAIHEFVFQRQLALPPTSSLFDFYEEEPTYPVEKPYAHIIIGGESEERFFAIEDYLSRKATPEGFLAFLKEQEGTRREHANTIRSHIIATQAWMIQREQASYYQDTPHYTIPIFTAIGSGKPTYYKTDYDIPHDGDIQAHLTRWDELTQSTQTNPGARYQLAGIRRDYEALLHIENVSAR